MGAFSGIKSAARRTGLRWPKRQSIYATMVEGWAEYEAKRSTPGAPIRMRRHYLKLREISAPPQFWFGPDLFVHGRGNLKLGNRLCVGGACRMMNFCSIEIGEDFLAADGLIINTASHDPVTLDCLEQTVKIGHRVWVGARVTILGGVTIGDDVVIGAGSVVTRDIPSNSIAVGVPAKVMRPLDRPPGQKLYSIWPD